MLGPPQCGSSKSSLLLRPKVSLSWSRAFSTTAGVVRGVRGLLLLWTASTAIVLSQSRSVAGAMSVNNDRPLRVIDSHVHIWANALQATSHGFPYVPSDNPPPDSLRDVAHVESLHQNIQTAGLTGALIVQPIHHLFDHSYVRQALTQYPDTFKGMLLHDPSLSSDAAVARLEELALAGFVGVRFNPYLWNKVDVVAVVEDEKTTKQEQRYSPMSRGAGLAVYRRCGELRMPVGIMCFQGLSLHYDDIVELLTQSPETIMILDHFGFTAVGKDDNDANDLAFAQLLELAKYPAAHVKISALFRLGDTTPTYSHVYEQRFVPLLQAFGPHRLLYGSDFPYVLQQPPGYAGMHELVSSWCPDDESRTAILGGTAERLFGLWGSHTARPRD
jgi:predicted TIM-barrel fold metal-dependent hydrolase